MVMRKGRRELLGIAKIALVTSVLMIALTPLANAAIIEFTITPDTVWSCEETTIIVEVKSNTSWHWQNTTIPAGFCVEMPTTGGVQIVRTDFWDDSGYVGHVTIKSNMTNPSSQVDVTVMINSDEVTFTKDITYAPGGTFTINSPFGGGSMLEVRWPTETEEGYANVSVPGVPLKDITDVYTVRICCPPSGETYTFFATAEGDPVGKSDSVVCSVPVPANVIIKPETLNLASKGVFTAFIQLPEGYDVADIDINTVVCEGAPAIRGIVLYGTYIAIFNRQDLVNVTTGGEVTLTVTGELNDGTPFTGSDTIRVIEKGEGKKLRHH